MCIGAQKAGTTWLFQQLDAQPDYWLPPVKELHFFNMARPHPELAGVESRGRPKLIDPGPGSLAERVRRTVWRIRYGTLARTPAWYYTLFPERWIGDRLAGDITPAYSTLAAEGVAFAREVLKPGCRVVLIVRNPIERAWSALKMLYRWRSEDITEEDERELLERLRAPSYRLRGDYPRIIDQWSEVFGDDFRVFRFDDLREDAGTFLREITDFLGAPADMERAPLARRPNRDPTGTPVPEPIRRRLRAWLEPEIRELDRRLPGVADLWLAT